MSHSSRCYLLGSLSLLCALLLPSCATYQLPEGYSGATANINSSNKTINSVKGEGYYVEKVDGKFTKHSPMATPNGAGVGLALNDKVLRVPCEVLTLSLRGGNIYAADGVAMADSMIGGNHSASGEVIFTPKPNAEYTVTGLTGKDYTAAWIIDRKTGKVVTSKVESR